jgi:hypothetical protein
MRTCSSKSDARSSVHHGRRQRRTSVGAYVDCGAHRTCKFMVRKEPATHLQCVVFALLVHRAHMLPQRARLPKRSVALRARVVFAPFVHRAHSLLREPASPNSTSHCGHAWSLRCSCTVRTCVLRLSARPNAASHCGHAWSLWVRLLGLISSISWPFVALP